MKMMKLIEKVTPLPRDKHIALWWNCLNFQPEFHMYDYDNVGVLLPTITVDASGVHFSPVTKAEMGMVSAFQITYNNLRVGTEIIDERASDAEDVVFEVLNLSSTSSFIKFLYKTRTGKKYLSLIFSDITNNITNEYEQEVSTIRNVPFFAEWIITTTKQNTLNLRFLINNIVIGDERTSNEGVSNNLFFNFKCSANKKMTLKKLLVSINPNVELFQFKDVSTPIETVEKINTTYNDLLLFWKSENKQFGTGDYFPIPFTWKFGINDDQNYLAPEAKKIPEHTNGIIFKTSDNNFLDYVYTDDPLIDKSFPIFEGNMGTWLKVLANTCDKERRSVFNQGMRATINNAEEQIVLMADIDGKNKFSIGLYSSINEATPFASFTLNTSAYPFLQILWEISNKLLLCSILVNDIPVFMGGTNVPFTILESNGVGIGQTLSELTEPVGVPVYMDNFMMENDKEFNLFKIANLNNSPKPMPTTFDNYSVGVSLTKKHAEFVGDSFDENPIEFNPTPDYEKPDLFLEQIHESIFGNRFVYTYYKKGKWEIPINYMSKDYVDIINQWWKNKQPLWFYPDLKTNPHNCIAVILTNEEMPFSRMIEGGTWNKTFEGVISLEEV